MRRNGSFFRLVVALIIAVIPTQPVFAQARVLVDNASQQIKDVERDRITLDYKDADLASALQALSYSYGLNLVAIKDIQGKVNLTLNNVTVDEALEAVLKVNGYAFTRKGNIIYVTTGGGVEGLDTETVSIPVRYIPAAEISKLVQKALSSKGDVRINEATNSLVVTDYPENIIRFRTLLAAVDTKPLQVLIEAKLVDISEQDIRDFGVSTPTSAPTGGITYDRVGDKQGLFRRKTLFDETLTVSSVSTGNIATSLALKGFAITNLQIDALIQDKKAKLLATPSILTLSGKEARIVIGERYPYKEKTQTTTGTTETTKFMDIGITLKVNALVSPDGWITMSVHPEVSSWTATLDAGPRVATREADAMVRIRDGQTLIMAGLIQRNDDSTIGKVPFLGSIPILGWFFRQYNRNAESKELVIFLTPRIINSDSNSFPNNGSLQDSAISIKSTGDNVLGRVLWEEAVKLIGNDDTISRGKGRHIRLKEAIQRFRQYARYFPDSARAEEALYRAADLAYSGLNDPEMAADILEDLIQNYPHGRYWKSAQKRRNVFLRKVFAITGKRPAADNDLDKDVTAY